jgi:hypothetical protein
MLVRVYVCVVARVLVACDRDVQQCRHTNLACSDVCCGKFVNSNIGFCCNVCRYIFRTHIYSDAPVVMLTSPALDGLPLNTLRAPAYARDTDRLTLNTTRLLAGSAPVALAPALTVSILLILLYRAVGWLVLDDVDSIGPGM